MCVPCGSQDIKTGKHQRKKPLFGLEKTRDRREMKDEILHFLENMGPTHEALKWLNVFRAIEPSKFALLKVSGECVENSLDMLCTDLCFLQQMELYPVVIFGWGKRVTEELNRNGIKSEFYGGDRITTEDTLRVILGVVDDFKKKIEARMGLGGGSTADLTTTGIFYGRPEESGNLGLVGKIERINLSPVLSAIRGEKIPLLVPLCYTEGGQLLNTNSATAGKMLYREQGFAKYIYLTEIGGVFDKNDKLIREIILRRDYQALVESGFLNGGMLKNVNEAKEALEGIGPEKSVHITSPPKLLYELFTNSGDGTKITSGYKTLVFDSMAEVDKQKLRQLIEKRFKKPLVPSFFTDPAFGIDKIILEGGYNGALFIQKVDDAWYMDKYVVSEEFSGNGLGSELFSYLFSEAKKECCTKIFWRAKKENPHNTKYTEILDELSHEGVPTARISGSDYTYYFIGIESRDVDKFHHFAETKPSSFGR